MQEFTVSTSSKAAFIDITSKVMQIVAQSKIKDGLATVFVPHTTAGITINENADPSVTEDILSQLEKMAPQRGGYDHVEGNADGHIKATLVGSSVSVAVGNSKLILGTWQGIFFCEFDGPRKRKVYVKVM